jgi:hypothetical protein
MVDARLCERCHSELSAIRAVVLPRKAKGPQTAVARKGVSVCSIVWYEVAYSKLQLRAIVEHLLRYSVSFCCIQCQLTQYFWEYREKNSGALEEMAYHERYPRHAVL